MEKTRLGPTIKLVGAALYFIAIIGITPLVIAAGYTLVVEPNQWLRRVAVKAIAVVVFFAILNAFVGLFMDSTSLLSNIVMLFNGTINLATVNRLATIVRIIIGILQTIALLLLGFRALKMKDANIGVVDGTVTSNI